MRCSAPQFRGDRLPILATAALEFGFCFVHCIKRRIIEFGSGHLAVYGNCRLDNGFGVWEVARFDLLLDESLDLRFEGEIHCCPRIGATVL